MKAILVIDMPSSCIECRYSLLGGCYCTLTQEDLIVNDGDISENCPLKPMPKRILTLVKMNNGEILNNNEIQYMKGRNDCIDEILGEQE